MYNIKTNNMSSKKLMLFSLSNSIEYTKKLYPQLSISRLQTFSDSEFKPDIDESVRGRRVVICGCLKTMNDVGELLMLADAAKRAGSKEVIAVVTYLPFMRQDRKDTPRTSIGAKVIANIIESGYNSINQIITLDLHASQIEGFFNIPMTHLKGHKMFCPYIQGKFDMKNIKIISPDAGGAKRAEKFLEELNIPESNYAMIYKVRKEANKVESMYLLGEIEGYHAIIVDDMVDTAGSLCKAAELLLEKGATGVSACITHPILSGEAINRIRNSNITKLYVSDSIPLSEEAKTLPNIEVVSSVNLFNNALKAIESKISLNSLF